MKQTRLYLGWKRCRMPVTCLVLLPAFPGMGPAVRGQDPAPNFQLVSPYEALPHQYRGQMHMHTVGIRTPDEPYIGDEFHPSRHENPGSPDAFHTSEAMVANYRDHGYDFAAITDHWVFTPDPGVTGILCIPGEEVSAIIDGESCHANAFGITETIPSDTDVQDIIDLPGVLVQLNHPRRTRIRNENVDAVTGLWGMEVANALNKHFSDVSIWDRQISQGKRIWASATDDSHDIGVVRNANVVNCSELSEHDILYNLRRGNFYACEGPDGPDIACGVTGNVVSCSTTTAGSEIRWYKENLRLIHSSSNALRSDVTVVGDEVFVRAEVEAPNGKIAYSQPIFVEPVPPANGQSFATSTYTVSDEDFANPERGFYFQSTSYAGSPVPIPGNLADYRVNGRSSPGGTYTAKVSLLLRLYYLDTFVHTPISAGFLDMMQVDFDSIRAQGCKAVLRIAYNKDQTRPFDEPSKARILAHIQQLKPLLQENADVIAVLQQGLIGAWGEGYFTDVFYTNHQATAQNWLDRSEVVEALLEALPVERMVQVRVPQMKQKFVGGPSAPVSFPPLHEDDVLDGSAFSRVAFHNDCFLASPSDFGTFSDYDVGEGTSAQDIAAFRNYLAAETRFTSMGGETCWVNPPTDDCATVGGSADSDMALFHYSYLNQAYNADVNDDWVTGGCIESIKRRLGYRLQLVSGRFRTEAQPGQAIPLTLEFSNIGYAAPFNPRGIELVLRHTTTGEKLFAALSRDTDARRWLPGTNHVLTAQMALPANMPAGDYDLLLNLPDPAPTLYGMVPFSIRLANSNALSSAGVDLGGVWEAGTGYHHLRQTLSVNATATNPLPDGSEIPVLDYSAIAEVYDTWETRNFETNPGDGLPGANPDADNRLNLEEYAVGSNPNVADSGGYMRASLDTGGFTLAAPKGPGAANDVRYEVEGTPSLVPESWSEDWASILENSSTMFRARFLGETSNGVLRMKFTLDP